MKKLVLKYNARVGKNHLPEIEEMTKRLGLTIQKMEDGRPGQTRLAIVGTAEKLIQMDRELVRYASITRKCG